MKIKLNQKILGIDGIHPLSEELLAKDFIRILPKDLQDKVLYYYDTTQEEILDLKKVCITAVLQSKKEDTEKQKYEDYELFVKIRDCKTKEIELTTEEIVKIKKKIGAIYKTLILGQSWDFLEAKK